MSSSNAGSLREGGFAFGQGLNWTLILTVFLLGLVGVGTLYSAAGGSFEPWAWRHGLRLTLGLGLMLAVAALDMRVLYNGAYLVFAGLLLLLVSVQLFGDVTMGAKRWLDLGIVTVQPSEFIRLGMILALARFYQSIHQDVVSHFQNFVVPAVIIIFPVALIINQPDLGTTIMLAVSGVGVLFLAGLDWRYFAAGAVGIVAAVPLVWQRLFDYQKERVLVFLNPERDPLGAGYHIIQSKIGIGSGGMFGKGFSEGTQSRLNFLPEKHTDFVFTIYAEEMGFVGSVLLLVLFVLLLVQLALIASQMRNQFARLVVGGIGFSLFVYIFINLAMVMGLAPVVGVPLPFISYGGTSMLTFLISIGIVLSLERQMRVEMSRG
ncbi:MAG TPA: rod shape-determining protein RodA [Rhodobiaceae bacterium]|nr:MAG: Peptidoglycan glycosyltransferase MrdB [Rhodobiaceae bacterium UBA7378]HCQ82123.1 rod shape-determining protein RodA [Rhodobiaceae bacterium]|tara:strand:+ start:62 stop:1192 length:1131 start_codon:yes stop_codon:yes gene_type:complete